MSRLMASARTISIHALREEGDGSHRSTAQRPAYFYPRPPRGGRQKKKITNNRYLAFLSTPSARRATPVRADLGVGDQNFYPRPPRGGRPECRVDVGAGGGQFLSTPSARRATACPSRPAAARWYFYPRPPRGGRLMDWTTPERFMLVFLSTPSARRATWPAGAWVR